MRVSLLRIGLLLAICSMIISLGCQGDTPASLEPEGDLLGINIFNAPESLRPGQVHALGATGLYSGTATYNITAYATWTSSDPAVIEIIGKGLLRPVGGGTATIACNYRGVSSTGVQIKIEGPPVPGSTGPEPIYLASILVEPTSAAVDVDATQQFTATAIYSNDTTQVITILVDWRVSDDDPGFIIDRDNMAAWGANYGLFRATGPVGSTVVSCEYMGVISNYVTVIVK